MNPRGNLPRRKPSHVIDGERKEVDPRDRVRHGGDQAHRIADPDDNGTTGLFGETFRSRWRSALPPIVRSTVASWRGAFNVLDRSAPTIRRSFGAERASEPAGNDPIALDRRPSTRVRRQTRRRGGRIVGEGHGRKTAGFMKAQPVWSAPMSQEETTGQSGSPKETP